MVVSHFYQQEPNIEDVLAIQRPQLVSDWLTARTILLLAVPSGTTSDHLKLESNHQFVSYKVLLLGTMSREVSTHSSLP